MSRPASHKAASLVPVLAYEAEHRLFLCDDVSLAYGFSCQPMWGGDEGTEQRIRALLDDDWPAGTTIGFHLIASPDLATLFEAIRTSRRHCDNRVLASVIDERLAHLRSGVDRPLPETETFVRDFRLIIVVKRPIAAMFPTADELLETARLQQRTQDALAALPVNPRPIDADGFVTLMSTLLNRGRYAAWRPFGRIDADPGRLLCEQLLDADNAIRFERTGAWLGETRLSLLSIKTYPTHVAFGHMAYLVGDVLHGARGLKDPFLLTVSLHFPEIQKTRTSLDTQRKWALHQSTGPLVRWLPALAERARDYDILFRSLGEGHRPVQIATTLAIYSPDLRQADTACSNAITYWHERGCTLMRDHFIIQPLLVNALPFGADRKAVKDLGRYRTMTSEHISRLLPVLADWRGSPRPVANLISRSGQVMHIDLFDSSGGYNAVIAAQTGSGKSFFTNHLICSYLSLRAGVWVIDIGRSYQNLNQLLDGEYIDVGGDDAIDLNPFPLVHDYAEEGPMLEGLVIAMAAPTEKLSDFQTRALGQLMLELWGEHGPRLSIDAIAERLKTAEDLRLRDVGAQLFPFTRDGPYGRYFRGDGAISFRNPFTVLELEHLKQRPDLQRVVLLMLIYQIQQAMFLGSRSQQKLLIVDEAWDLLADPTVAHFLNNAYRRFRKYNASAIIITQSIEDLHNSPVGRAIAENSANTFLLRQKPELIDRLIADKRLTLSAFGAQLVKSSQTVPGRFSEIYCITERGQGLGRLVVPPRLQLVYSTNPADIAAIRHHRERGLDLIAAIDAILEDRRRGRVA